MDSSIRPVTGSDHMPKEVIIHAGLIFAGHLNVARLRDATENLITVYPELNVYPKRKLLSFGKWWCPPATQPAWNFKCRENPDKGLADVFAPAAEGAKVDLSGCRISPLGTVDSLDAQDAFGFDSPSINWLGWAHTPAITIRVTLLGDKDTGHTLVGVVIPHILMDATGVAAIIKTLGQLYREENVPSRKGNPHPDLLSLLEPIAGNDVIKEDERPGKGSRYTLSEFWSFASETKKLVAKGIFETYIHVPGGLLQKHRDDARSSLTGDDVGLPLYIHSAKTIDMDKPFDFYHVYHMAFAFPEGSLPEPYLHNLNTPGWFPLPTSAELVDISLANIAIFIRKRLHALRTPTHTREQIRHFDRHSASIVQIPRTNPTHGWGMVSSWKEVDEAAREGFSDNKLVFVRLATQNPMGWMLPNIAWPFGDGKGGIFGRITTMKGDWETMWQKCGLGELR
ncbi:hypothetical protein HJFPF1_12305 [Paramyrothecium foliicola]|nr:hypothetical protein HJFPF1_12305 [Paramyrothecium foliicola]